MGKYRIFVYGTLLRGFGNYRRLLEKQATFITEAETPPTYTLLHLGGFPGLIAEGTTAVKGEVFEFDSDGVLQGLDWLEGHPTFYTRTPIKLADGTDAETYILNLTGKHSYRAVENGSWRTETGIKAPEQEVVNG
jgi:gamma-glutamylcyclotransferase (GGCT)/AIG2-like uncharacterized protein YtfP